jgi:hypothetical protein
LTKLLDFWEIKEYSVLLVGTRSNQGVGTRTNRRKVTDVPVSQEKYEVNRLSHRVR